jgi:hypothetical protein
MICGLAQLFGKYLLEHNSVSILYNVYNKDIYNIIEDKKSILEMNTQRKLRLKIKIVSLFSVI